MMGRLSVYNQILIYVHVSVCHCIDRKFIFPSLPGPSSYQVL